MRTLAKLLLCGAVFLAAGAFQEASAQANPNAIVTGTARETGPLGYDFTLTFSCRGVPTCAGTYTIRERLENCPNFIESSGPFTVTGLNLASSGPIQGTLTLQDLRAENGCSYGAVEPPRTLTYAGTWNAATGIASGNISGIDSFSGNPFSFPFTLTANVEAPAPVFDMSVTANITPTTATASAQIQFRPQDVGTSGSVFVFAYAPATRVRTGAEPTAKADGDCMLSQLGANGQLVPVTAGNMQPFFTGTLSSAGAAVNILNNASTPAVAGATFYVGYAPNAAAMLAQGIFRDAVLIPGSGTCPTLPFGTALWYNPREAGWGLNLNQQGTTLFGTLFTYDATHAPFWLVMSGGTMQADGRTYTGDLLRTTGPAFNAVPFTPIGAGNLSNVGRMTVTFNDANNATLNYTVDGTQVTKTIQRQVYGSRSALCLPAAGARTASTNYQDLWWNAAESGWGINITHQDNTLFATLFTYDAAGRGLWLVMSGGARQADGSYSGDLFRTAGPAFNAVPFTSIGPGDLTRVGTMRLAFSDGEHGTLTYTYNGAAVTKQITRQVFSGPVSACQ